MHGRDGRAPVALAGQPPVLELVGDGLGGAAAQFGHHGVRRGLAGHAVELPGVHQDAGLPGILRFDHLGDRDAVLLGELIVPLIMGGHAHHRAGAVVHEDVVGGKYRHLLPGERVDRLQPGKMAQLHVAGEALFPALGGHLIAEGLEPGIGLRRLLDERVLGGEGHEGHPVEGVQPGGEHRHLLAVGQVEGEPGPLGLADPVPLHGFDVLRPVDLVQVRQQLLGVAGDGEEVLLHGLLHHRMAGALVLAVHHLLVGQDRAQGLAPVHVAHGPEHVAALPHLDEEPLVPPVVLGQEGGDLPVPVIADAHLLDLALHLLDIVPGPDGRVDAVLDGRVLRRQAEGIPAQRVQHLVAAHAPEPGHHVAEGVVAHVAHVDAPAGVGQHHQHVEGPVPGLEFRGAGRAEGPGLGPALLDDGFLLQGLEGHDRILRLNCHCNALSARA